MKSKFLLFFLLFVSFSFAQITLYKTTDGILMTEDNYFQIKKEMNEREDLAGRYQEIRIKTENHNDTIVNTIKFERIMMVLKENQKSYDPYVKQRELIGNRFPIESFKDDAGNYFSSSYLIGKPTVINFWFINCPPCVEEIPDLNKLKKQYGDSVNFIAITFDNRKKVEQFMKKQLFNFKHITDSQKSIDELNIKSYPMTFLLNKEGEIINLYGALIFFQSKNLSQLISLLL